MRTRNIQPWGMALAFIAAGCADMSAPGQDRFPANGKGSALRAKPTFSVASDDDNKRLKQLRLAAAQECVRVLDLRARGELEDETGEAERAANVLVLLGSPYPDGISALCRNLTLRSQKPEPPEALAGFPAAKALIAIGGRRVAQAVFESMRGELDRQGLLLRAHVLARLEPKEVMVKRIELAIERRERETTLDGPQRELHLRNLRQVQSWLQDPTFFEDVSNWPSRVL